MNLYVSFLENLKSAPKGHFVYSDPKAGVKISYINSPTLE